MRFFRPSNEHPLTGWHMLAVVLAFFGVIIAVNVVMAFAATTTFPGLVVENSYVSSQHYNELLAAAREQDAAGWRDELAAENGILRFSLATAAGTPARGFIVTAHTGRPSTTREDRALAFVSTGSGRYDATEPLRSGLWEVDIEARRGEEVVFRRTHEIFVQSTESGK
jgi:nitrogen fixation protein FixH